MLVEPCGILSKVDQISPPHWQSIKHDLVWQGNVTTASRYQISAESVSSSFNTPLMSRNNTPRGRGRKRYREEEAEDPPGEEGEPERSGKRGVERQWAVVLWRACWLRVRKWRRSGCKRDPLSCNIGPLLERRARAALTMPTPGALNRCALMGTWCQAPRSRS